MRARVVIAGVVLGALVGAGTPAHAQRTDLIVGRTVRATGPAGVTVEAWERDILNVSEGPMGEPVPTLNHVTAMIVRDAANELICIAQPLAIFESDPFDLTIHIESGVANCLADLTWTSDLVILPEQVAAPNPIAVSLMREATVDGSLRGAGFTGAGRVSRGLLLTQQT